jgi:2-hydroxy-3-oxopropionate reductase
MSTPLRVGFVGLGLMGRPLAQHVLRAGYPLHLWARRPASLDPFRGQATLHDCPADLARQVDVLFTLVADGRDVESVIFGEQGLAQGARTGLIIVDMSTIAPPLARSIGERLAQQGVDFLDAPVSGGEIGAINACLSIMVGGKTGVFERVLPLFSLMGQSITHVGAGGAGQVAKACNQILTGVQLTAVAEALHFAQSSGVDAAQVRKALLGGFAYSKILDNHGQRMLEGNFRPGFKAWMHQKDLRIVMEEAHRLGLPLPTTAAAAQMFNALVGSGHAQDDSVAMFALFSRWSAPKPDTMPITPAGVV